MKYPLEINVEGGYLGKTSVSLTKKVMELRSQLVLLQKEFVLVNVDRDTFTPILLPDDYKKQYMHCFKDTTPPQISSFCKPDDLSRTHHFTRQAFLSDTDHLGHVTESIYSKYCLDAASLAERRGLLRGFCETHGFHQHRVSEVETVYRSQVHEGDVIDIYLWEEEEMPLTLFFQFEKEGKLVSRTAIRFHSQINASSNI
jgi:acyl-CoA thioesterase FadM